MRRFIAAFVATVAGLVVLLSFKTTGVKAPASSALSSSNPEDSPSAPVSSPVVSTPAASSAPVSSGPVSSAPVSSAAAATTPAATTAAAPTPKAPSPTPKATPKPTATAAPKPTTVTATGATYSVREGGRFYGTVVVQVTVSGTRITAVNASEDPSEDESAQIAGQAIPVLKSETLAAQGTHISNVSGATLTTQAYIESLQSALDKAKA